MEFVKKTMHELNRADAGFNRTKDDHFPVVLITDNVRSMHNIGSLFRTADALNIEKIFLCGLSPVPPHRDIQKTALGATESVQWEYIKDTAEAILRLRSEDYKIIGIEQVHNSISLEQYTVEKTDKLALIFGNEVEGITDSVLRLCNACIEIPQFGSKHSLNISVSAGIVLWEIAKKMMVL